ncbi:hypothetical protein JCM5296_003239 [Sporobolomyces johnsonii]
MILPSSSPEPPFHLEWHCPFHLERRLGLSPLHLPCHPDPICHPQTADGQRFFGKLGLDYSGLNFDGEESAPTNKPASDKVTHFEIPGLADMPDDQRPHALYLCDPSLIGGKKNFYAYALH